MPLAVWTFLEMADHSRFSLGLSLRGAPLRCDALISPSQGVHSQVGGPCPLHLECLRVGQGEHAEPETRRLAFASTQLLGVSPGLRAVGPGNSTTAEAGKEGAHRAQTRPEPASPPPSLGTLTLHTILTRSAFPARSLQRANQERGGWCREHTG